MSNTKSTRKILSAILTAAVLAISLAAFPLAVSADPGSDDYGLFILRTTIETEVNFNATGADAEGDGWAWNKDTLTLTITKSNFISVDFLTNLGGGEKMPNAPDSVTLAYSTDLSFPGIIYTELVNLTVEGNGKDGALLRAYSFHTSCGASLTFKNANISIISDGSDYVEEIYINDYQEKNGDLTIINSSIEMSPAGESSPFIYSGGNISITDSEIEIQGEDAWIYSFGSLSISDCEIDMQGENAQIIAAFGGMTVSGVSNIFIKGYIFTVDGVLSFNLAPGGRVETNISEDGSSIHAHSKEKEHPIVLGPGVKIAEPAGGYIFKSEDGMTYIITGDSSGEIKPEQYAKHIILINDTPVANTVTVTPGTASLKAGGTQQFSAAVAGVNDPAQTVTWSVSGNKSSATKISASGLLTVGADETAATLTVTATSTLDTSKFGTAAVTVTVTPGPGPGSKADTGNPKTGDTAPFLPLALLLICGGAALVLTNKKTVK